jgi:hypothetical protein
MADIFLGVVRGGQLPFGGVTGVTACPGSPQEGPAKPSDRHESGGAERGRSPWTHLDKPDSSKLRRRPPRRQPVPVFPDDAAAVRQ